MSSDTHQSSLENAIETPTGPGIQMHHMFTYRLSGRLPGGGFRHVINGIGDDVINRQKAIVK